MGQGSARYNSITDKEKKIVLDIWMEVRVHLFDFSSRLFLYMINQYPFLANYWPYNSSNDSSFDRFTKQFIKEFDFYVLHINRPTSILPKMEHHAAYHVTKNIPKEEYDRVRKCLVHMIGDHVGDQTARKEILDAWIKVIGILFGFLTEMQEDMAGEKKNASDLSLELTNV